MLKIKVREWANGETLRAMTFPGEQKERFEKMVADAIEQSPDFRELNVVVFSVEVYVKALQAILPAPPQSK